MNKKERQQSRPIIQPERRLPKQVLKPLRNHKLKGIMALYNTNIKE